LNLLCGCIAILLSFENLDAASYLIGIAIIFDFLDGFTARILNAKTDIGKDLDSLADVVSFGVAPGFILYFLIQIYSNELTLLVSGTSYIPFIAFVIPLFSALRLAKFNNDDRQTDHFIGLPTPANALLIASLPLIISQESTLTGICLDCVQSIVKNKYFLIALTVLLSYLLIAEIPLLSLKFQSFGWKENKFRYIFLGISLILLILFFYIAIPIIIIVYFILSLLSPKNVA
jgi:CDP-diacylglycerol--serine O-phosphatidyltransferase